MSRGYPGALGDLRRRSMRSILELLPEELPGEGYRKAQIAHWLYARGAMDFSEMTDLPKPLREALAKEWRISE
ncbi:hypothetical protein ABTA53_18640, partial [Acinetobacter baumannii]